MHENFQHISHLASHASLCENPRVRRIALLGGSFDPLHAGHVALARAACRRLAPDLLLLVPARVPPHKRGLKRARGGIRLAAARRAARALRAEGLPVRADGCELRRRGVSYTVDTVRALRRRFPDAAVILVVGADELTHLHTWRKARQLLGICRVAAAPRPGWDLKREIRLCVRRIGPDAKGRISPLPMRKVAASSTAIRRAAS